jgi:hypothetical protein
MSLLERNVNVEGGQTCNLLLHNEGAAFIIQTYKQG